MPLLELEWMSSVLLTWRGWWGILFSRCAGVGDQWESCQVGMSSFIMGRFQLDQLNSTLQIDSYQTICWNVGTTASDHVTDWQRWYGGGRWTRRQAQLPEDGMGGPPIAHRACIAGVLQADEEHAVQGHKEILVMFSTYFFLCGDPLFLAWNRKLTMLKSSIRNGHD